MLKSSNLESIIGAVAAESAEARTVDLLPSELPHNANNNNETSAAAVHRAATTATTTQPNAAVNNNNSNNNSSCSSSNASIYPDNGDVGAEQPASLATLQLTAGLLQIFEPPLVKARGQLKELIGKQNKIYIDLSAEKFKLDNAEIAKLHEMMNNVKIYREKLIKIKKQMQSIYQRTKVLKKRATNVQTCKQRELQRKLQKQQQEEALIGKQQEQQQQQQPPPSQPPTTQ